jgi:PKD repeat protein
MPTTDFADFPHLGHDNTQLILGYNLFPTASPDAPTDGAQITVLPKPATGDTTCAGLGTITNFGPGAATPVTLNNGDGTSMAATPIPANMQDSSAAGYVVAARDPTNAVACSTGSCSDLTLWKVTDNSGTPVLSSATVTPSTTGSDITVPAFTLPASAPQPGTSNTLDSLDTRLTQVVGHTDPGVAGSPEALWTQHGVSDPSDLTARSVMRWYELNPGSPASAVQTGTVSDPANSVFNGAISPTSGGSDASVFFNESGPAQLPQIRARIHAAGDPAGATSGEITLGTSTAVDNDGTCSTPPCRWGDYSGASPDPSNTNVVWGTNELIGSQSSVIPWTTQNFAVSTADQAPTAAFNLTPATALTGTPISFDSTPSFDPDGSIASWRWSFGDGANGSSQTMNHVYTRAGTYTVTLGVTDDRGLTATTTHTIVIADRPPVAVIRTNPADPRAGTEVSFDGSGSGDLDGVVTALHWSFGDGATATGVTAHHTFASQGTYTVTLTVTDNSGNQGSATQALKVDASCVVPRLKGKRFSRARKLLRQAHCALGHTRRSRSARHRPARRLVITRQRPPAGTVLPPDSRVSNTVRLARR